MSRTLIFHNYDAEVVNELVKKNCLINIEVIYHFQFE